MIKSLYTKYFQKSKIFLYPLLNLPKSSFITVQSYLMWENIVRLEDLKMICVFENTNKSYFKEYEEKYITNNPKLISKHPGDNNQILYIFDLTDHEVDYIHFTKGKYSLLSDSCKLAIKRYNGSTSREYEYVETYLFPDRFYEHYSKLLDVDEESLMEVGELCDVFDINKEFIKFLEVKSE